jgi:hypothetical protein
MFERRWRLGVAIALVVLVVGGCASSAAISPASPSEARDRPPGAETISNFASPTDILQRYPAMRRQQL